MKKITFLFFAILATLNMYSQSERIFVWDNKSAPSSNEIPDNECKETATGITKNNKTELFIFGAVKPTTGQAVVICPGGGYGGLAITYEGYDMARWLAANGITAAVLRYRMPNGHCEIPRTDADEAMRILKTKAVKYGFDTNKVGIIGSSAGGHLAASVGVFSNPKPAFMILFYPVITSTPGELHQGSFNNLLGKQYSKKLANKYSLEKQVTINTPPTFLLLSDDDKAVPPINSILFYNALKSYGIKASMHIFPIGGHGWGIKPTFKYINEWKHLLLDWLEYINQSNNNK